MNKVLPTIRERIKKSDGSSYFQGDYMHGEPIEDLKVCLNLIDIAMEQLAQLGASTDDKWLRNEVVQTINKLRSISAKTS